MDDHATLRWCQGTRGYQKAKLDRWPLQPGVFPWTLSNIGWGVAHTLTSLQVDQSGAISPFSSSPGIFSNLAVDFSYSPKARHGWHFTGGVTLDVFCEDPLQDDIVMRLFGKLWPECTLGISGVNLHGWSFYRRGFSQYHWFVLEIFAYFNYRILTGESKRSYCLPSLVLVLVSSIGPACALP